MENREKMMGKNYSMTFFGKVMVFFSFAVLASLAGCFIAMNYAMEYFVQHPGMIYVLFAAELILVLTSRLWSQRSPMNKLLFGLFAFITGVTVAPLIFFTLMSAGGIIILMKALLATFLTFLAAAIFGWTTSFNLSGLRGFLMIGLIGMIIVGIIGIFLPWGSTMEIVYSGFGVLLFTGYIMFDFQRLKAYPENMYIEAALQLYLDIFNLFIYILRLLSANRR